MPSRWTKERLWRAIRRRVRPGWTKERLVRQLLARTGGHTYVEIGVGAGDSFWKVTARRNLGIDPAPDPSVRAALAGFTWRKGLRRYLLEQLGLVTTTFFELTSDAFFAQHAGLFTEHPIDVALIDGLHTAEQALRDVEHCLAHLGPRGVIALHDCNPPTAAAAASAPSLAAAEQLGLPDWTGDWCGDVWKAMVQLRAGRDDLRVFVLDCDWGVGIVTRGQPVSRLADTPETIAQMTYEDLARDRSRLLHLQPPGALAALLG